jgi:DNA-binding NarL/FixJ family response regulator
MVVEDHDLVRQTLCDRLKREPDFKVVATAATAQEAIEQTLAHEPAIILMDIDLDGVASLEATVRITSLRPSTRIIFVSAFAHDRYIDRALALRAHGYVTKREKLNVLIDAIRAVASGRRYFSEEIHSRFVEAGACVGDSLEAWPGRQPERSSALASSDTLCPQSASAQVSVRATIAPDFVGPLRPFDELGAPEPRTRFATITPRQRQILAYIADGRSKREIANLLHVSVKTVESHCEALMARLCVHDRVGLARYAIREGLVSP